MLLLLLLVVVVMVVRMVVVATVHCTNPSLSHTHTHSLSEMMCLLMNIKPMRSERRLSGKAGD